MILKEKHVIEDAWAHRFIHTLGLIPKMWYIQHELHWAIATWTNIVHDFHVTFKFEVESIQLEKALQIMHDIIFAIKLKGNTTNTPLCPYHRTKQSSRDLVKCYKVDIESDDDEDLRNLNIPETEGERQVAIPSFGNDELDYTKTMRTTQVNIGIEEKPKVATIGDYWDKNIIN